METTGFHNSLQQRGVATLLILILVAIAISAAIFGALRYIQGTQDQTVAFNAQSRAQIVAWSGVELLFQYFQNFTTDGEHPKPVEEVIEVLDTIRQTPNNHGELGEIDIQADHLKAFIRNINPAGPDRYEVTVDITGSVHQGNKASSSSTIQVVYLIEKGSEPVPLNEGSPNPPAVITFNRDLKLGGSINVQTAPGEKYVVNVKGTVNATNGNSITGVDTINATDSIHIGSGSSFNTLNSNGDIKLTGSVSGDGNLAARGNICLIGGTSATGSVKANGFVYGDGSASFGDIEAIGTSTYTGPNRLCDAYLLYDANNSPFAINMAGDNSVRRVKAKGSARFNSGTVTSNPGIEIQGDLRDTNWGGRQIGTISGAIQNFGNNPQVPQDIQVNSELEVSINPLEDLSVEVSSFNAYLYESQANYAFKVNANGFMTVTVRSVYGIPDGTYYIGSYATGPYKDRLCTGLTDNSSPSAPTCNLPASAEASYKICWGYSDWNNCFSYNSNTKTWSVNGLSMAQGIAWFEGNLSVGNGTYYNTFIATGNISTAGSHRSYAPNYAGYSGTINGSTYAPQGICTNSISPHYPLQLCNPDGTYNTEGSGGIGNYAFMAGSIQNGAYVGGNIALGSSTVSHGNVLAGNEFNSGGSTTVFGYITALGGGATTYNSMGGSTTIIVNQLPPTFTPMGEISPCTGEDCGCVGENCGESPSTNTRVLWTRYL